MDKAILPECFGDTLLIEALVKTNVGYNHQHSCFRVEAMMKQGVLKDAFAVGIIDKDKKTITYLREFDLIDECPDFLKLHHHPQKPHYIIQICPALESWILEVYRLGNIDIKAYGLPDTLEALKTITKRQIKLSETPGLHQLFQHLRARPDIAPVSKMIHWVSVLKEHNYSATVEELTAV